MAAKQVPEGYVVYNKELPGYTARVAVKKDAMYVPEESGFIMAEDQESPVYTILVKKGDGVVIHEGADDDPVPRHLKEEAESIVQKRIASSRKNFSMLAFEFAASHQRLMKEGKVPDEVAEYRLTVCTGVDKNGTRITDTCTNYVNENGLRGSGNCKGCGCPKWTVSAMHRPRKGGGQKTLPGKVWYPMGCPQGKFAPRHGRRWNNDSL